MPSQKMITGKLTASVEQIESRIFIIRGQKVMLDTNLMSQIATSGLWSQIVTTSPS